MSKKKVLFVVPDGVGIKNYLFTEILPLLLKEKVKILVYHDLDNTAIKEVKKIHDIDFDTFKISSYKESLIEKFLRETIVFARLHYNAKLVNNPTILTNWNYNKKGLQKIFYKLVQFFGFITSKSYKNILWLEKKYDNLKPNTLQKEINFLNQHQIDIVFSTHQRAVNAIPIFKAAKKLNIKSVGVIYSWDNLPKARLAVKTELYLVWSKYMKKELKLFYPEIKEKNINITGTPQFDFYKDNKNLLDKDMFFKQFSLDIHKKTICFSGDDKLTSPYDPLYLEDLCKAIYNNNFQEKVQIIFRRCPVDVSGRYDKIIKKYTKIIHPIAPLWSNDQKNWNTLYPFYKDVQLLTNICAHSDLVINLGSTMALDFSFFNKPCAYLNYNTTKDHSWSVETIYKFQHFRSMPNKDSVYWINNKDDFFPIIIKAFKYRDSLAKDWFSIINLTNENNSLNIANQILN